MVKTTPSQKIASTLLLSKRLIMPLTVITSIPKDKLIATRRVFKISLTSSSLLIRSKYTPVKLNCQFIRYKSCGVFQDSFRLNYLCSLNNPENQAG